MFLRKMLIQGLSFKKCRCTKLYKKGFWAQGSLMQFLALNLVLRSLTGVKLPVETLCIDA
jgi:hypothetical protein